MVVITADINKQNYFSVKSVLCFVFFPFFVSLSCWAENPSPCKYLGKSANFFGRNVSCFQPPLHYGCIFSDKLLPLFALFRLVNKVLILKDFLLKLRKFFGLGFLDALSFRFYARSW